MTQLAAGTMRHRVTIQTRKQSTGSRGESTEQWTDEHYRWSDVKHLSGRELEQARQLVATATTSFTMRKPNLFELTPKHRICFRGETYNIKAVTPSGAMLEDVTALCERVL